MNAFECPVASVKTKDDTKSNGKKMQVMVDSIGISKDKIDSQKKQSNIDNIGTNCSEFQNTNINTSLPESEIPKIKVEPDDSDSRINKNLTQDLIISDDIKTHNGEEETSIIMQHRDIK